MFVAADVNACLSYSCKNDGHVALQPALTYQTLHPIVLLAACARAREPPAFTRTMQLGVWTLTLASAGPASRMALAVLPSAATKTRRQTALLGARAAATTGLHMMRPLDVQSQVQVCVADCRVLLPGAHTLTSPMSGLNGKKALIAVRHRWRLRCK